MYRNDPERVLRFDITATPVCIVSYTERAATRKWFESVCVNALVEREPWMRVYCGEPGASPDSSLLHSTSNPEVGASHQFNDVVSCLSKCLYATEASVSSICLNYALL